MRQLFTTVLILVSVWANAQCPQAPECSNPVQLNGNLPNYNFSGNPCIAGYGTIPPSANWGSWDYMNFMAAGIIDVNKPINFPGGAKKVWCSGSNVNFNGIFNMTDGDTTEIGDLCAVNIVQLIANNGGQGNFNVIRMGFGATLFVDGVQHFIGDTICTVPGNPAHNVYVISCTAGTPLPILKFELHDNILSWEVTGDVEIQYSSNAKSWDSKYFTSQRKGTYNVTDPGFYRLKSEGWYSHVEQYRKVEIKIDHGKMYNALGQEIKHPKQFDFYLQGGKKYIKLP